MGGRGRSFGHLANQANRQEVKENCVMAKEKTLGGKHLAVKPPSVLLWISVKFFAKVAVKAKVAQLVEHRFRKAGVVSSILTFGSSIKVRSFLEIFSLAVAKESH